MKRLILLMIFGLWAAVDGVQAQAPADTADARFQALYEREWQWRQEQWRGVASQQELVPEDLRGSLPRVNAKAQQERSKYWTQVVEELDAIDTQALSAENRISAVIYRDQIEQSIAGVRFADYQMPFNSDSSFWSSLGYMSRRSLRDADEATRYISLLADIPRYFDEQMDNMRAGLARGFSVPRATLDGRDVAIENVATLEDPRDSELFGPLRSLPTSLDEATQERLQTQAEKVLRDKVIPAHAKLLIFYRDEYMPAARTTLAAEVMPDGKAWYAQQIRNYTTLELTAQEIHDMGQKEVARIQEQLLETMAETGFEGDFGQFLDFLRSDPQFYAKTPEELLMRAAWIAKRVDGKLEQFFGFLPRKPFTIIPVPDDIAPFYTTGRGGAGVYLVNTYDLPSRPLYNLPALTLHEAAPGHAMQGALAAERAEQPAFRRYSYISAFGEGWGLYVEKLGNEMGIYTTPYEQFGRLTYEMWRAARLVIDTGIHHLGWSRDQALDFMRQRTALSEHEITTEIDRYISWPAQALSYKLGEMKIVELRARAEKELGDKFDLRNFHDMVLALGSVPLPILEEQVAAFIKAGGPAPARPDSCACKQEDD